MPVIKFIEKWGMEWKAMYVSHVVFFISLQSLQFTLFFFAIYSYLQSNFVVAYTSPFVLHFHLH